LLPMENCCQLNENVVTSPSAKPLEQVVSEPARRSRRQIFLSQATMT